MQLIVCTVGTSIANGCPSLKGYQQRSTAWEEEAADLSAEVREKLADADMSDPGMLRKLSAELNSLERLGLEKEDHVALLATDTAEGRCCAEWLQKTISTVWRIPEEAIEICRIPGLQVRDGKRLREEGLPSLVSQVMSYRERWNTDQIVLNPTGGFKGVVPFLTVLGMVFRLRTVYVFEFAEQLINLPPLPFSFDANVLERALPALQRLSEEGAVPEADYWSRIVGFQDYERDLFLSLVETENESGFITLSPLVEPFMEQVPPEESIFLSPEVQGTLSKSKGADRDRLEMLLSKIAVPLWRSMHSHHYQSTDLAVFKPGNTPERAACIVRGDDVFVCRAFLSHDEYERELPKLKEADFELDAFEPYTPTTVDRCLAEMAEREKTELEQTREEVRRLREKEKSISSLKSEVKTYKKQLEEANDALRKRRKSKSSKKKKEDEKLPISEGEKLRCRVERISDSGVPKLAVVDHPECRGIFYTSKDHNAPPANECKIGAVFDCVVKKASLTNALFNWVHGKVPPPSEDAQNQPG